MIGLTNIYTKIMTLVAPKLKQTQRFVPLQKQKSGIAFSVAFEGFVLLFFSRILGLCRDLLLLYLIGPQFLLDALLLALKLPNLFRRLYAEGVFSQALLPAFLQLETKAVLAERVAALIGSLLPIMAVLFSLSCFSVPFLVCVLAPGFLKHSAAFLLTQRLLYFTLPYLFISILNALYTAALLSKGNNYRLIYMMPALLNLIILAVLFVFEKTSLLVYAIAVAYTLGACVQLCCLSYCFYKKNGFLKPYFAFGQIWLKNIFIEFFPVSFMLSFLSLSFLIDMIFASTLQAGSVSIVYAVERVFMLPVSILSTPSMYAWFTSLNKVQASPKPQRFLQGLPRLFLLLCFICIFVSIMTHFYAFFIIKLLFQHGMFSYDDSLRAGGFLAILAFALLPVCFIKPLCFLAQQTQRTRLAFYVVFLGVLCKLILNVYYLFVLHQGLKGFAFSTMIAAYAVCLLLALCFYLKKSEILQNVSF